MGSYCPQIETDAGTFHIVSAEPTLKEESNHINGNGALTMSKYPSLADLDDLIKVTHTAAVRELGKAEKELAVIKARRDELADRVKRLALALGLDIGTEQSSEEPVAQELAPPAATKTETESDSEEAQRGLWNDIYKVLDGRKRAVRSSSIIKQLVLKMGYEDTQALRNNVHNSMSRWARSNRLDKRGRGLFKLASEQAAEPQPKRQRRPRGSSKNLWTLVEASIKESGAMRANTLIDNLEALGWTINGIKDRKTVYNYLATWALEGKLARPEKGVYALPA
ncbi:MAG: hypothetical protein CO108_06065 [Deltaproteobacteria bacterium CG_4_9_14_3_um_filter_63_12]|nr:MAG: hypothetical protein CO108_06065 [Deltaproteobacteria bacterium CG_4_9_14_3_um_filter_63_12]